MSATICDYCGNLAEKCSGADIYPHRQDLFGRSFLRCVPCGAYVGCHEKTGEPFGRLANKALRAAKVKAHAAFDPLWKAGKLQSRSVAYAWLATIMGIHKNECHIGMFDENLCAQVVVICNCTPEKDKQP